MGNGSKGEIEMCANYVLIDGLEIKYTMIEEMTQYERLDFILGER